MTARLHLTKHHGLGNDFLVALLPAVPRDAASLAVRLCDRRRGIGADGLIVGTPPVVSARGSGAGAVLVMHLWNADGSIAEISGNGIRCLAQAEVRRLGLAEADLLIDTLGGARRVQVRPTEDPRTVLASVAMGKARQGAAIAGAPAPDGVAVRRAATVDVGNPHVVLLVDDPAAVDVAVAGPAVEALFPGGINVHFVRVVSPGELQLRVWERGAGVTEACGSGATAAAWAARQWGLAERHVRVVMPGGAVEVDLPAPARGNTADADAVGELTLTGPATYVADIEVPQ